MLRTDGGPVLSPQLLLAAYRQGFFPMAADDGAIEWHNPDPRAVFPLAGIQPNARFRRFLRNAGFRLSMNEAFAQVIRHCATVHGDSWISPAMQEAYVALHGMGHAISTETWIEDQLVGGIYGVSIGNAFFGESMFSLATNAGKAAFHRLAEHLRQQGYTLFDTQYINEHTASLGAMEIPRARFFQELKRAVATPFRI